MRWWRWALPIASLGAVVWFTWWDVSRLQGGPGPLHPAHRGVAALDGGANCAGCHDGGAVSARACSSCHEPIARQLEEGLGLHGSLGAEARCEVCHSEHHGAELPLIPEHAFARAGVVDAQRYDHRHVAFGLTGAHEGLACDRCHRHADDAAPPAGGRFLSLSQACTSCHDDAHRGAFGADCASCHGQERPWSTPPGFGHERFALDGAHARVGCAGCHPDGGGRSVADEQRAALDVRSCAACHEDPHGAGGGSLPLAERDDCRRCHDATSWTAARPTVAEHGALGFALRGAHAEADCGSCHGGAGAAPRWGASTAPANERCAVCHQHPHGATLVQQAVAAGGQAQDCAGCHGDADATFSGGTITPAQHLATGFPLAAPHQDLACTACHGGAQRFPGRAAADCRACHSDAHAGQLGDGEALRQCTECHAPHAFAPHRFDAAAHRAVFALTGAHDAVACARCHAQVHDGVRRFVGTARACAGCHEDVHAGAFDGAGRPRAVDGAEGCARCHTTRGFRELGATFDHALWTGYALVGAHQQVACAQCHGRSAAGQLGKAPGARCSDCHSDPHAGQFLVAGETDCRRCHEAAAWQNVRFDHGRDSRFALDAVHEKLACARCHKPEPVGARQVVRYRPLGRTCGDCHRVGHEARNRNGGGR